MLGEGQVLVLLEDLLDLLQQGLGFSTGLGALEPPGKFHVVVEFACKQLHVLRLPDEDSLHL